MRRLTWDWRQVIAEGGLLFLHLDTELVLRNKPDRTHLIDLDFGARPISSSSGKYQILRVPQKHVRGRWERLATCRWLVCQKTFETFDQARSYVACWDEHDL